MSIQNILSKINSLLGEGAEQVLIVVSIALAGILGSGIAYIAINSNEAHIDPVFTTFDAGTAKVQQTANVLGSVSKNTETENPIVSPGKVYASKNGRKYYYPNCSGLNRIKEENKISFNSSAEAESQGYTLASGCK